VRRLELADAGSEGSGRDSSPGGAGPGSGAGAATASLSSARTGATGALLWGAAPDRLPPASQVTSVRCAPARQAPRPSPLPPRGRPDGPEHALRARAQLDMRGGGASSAWLPPPSTQAGPGQARPGAEPGPAAAARREVADAMHARLAAAMTAQLERTAAADPKHGERLRLENYAFLADALRPLAGRAPVLGRCAAQAGAARDAALAGYVRQQLEYGKFWRLLQLSQARPRPGARASLGAAAHPPPGRSGAPAVGASERTRRSCGLARAVALVAFVGPFAAVWAAATGA